MVQVMVKENITMLSASATSVCLVRGYKGECPVAVTQCLVTLYRHRFRV